MTRREGKDSNKAKTKVLLVDDHPVVRNGLAQLINLQSDLVVCGEADDGPAALKALAQLRPEVAVLDLTLGKDIEGLALIKDINVRFPHVVILVLSMHDEAIYAERALRAGALGYVMKAAAMKTLLTAIRQVLRGEVYVSPRIAKKLLAQLAGRRPDQAPYSLDRLSDRELELLHLIGGGLGARQAAEILHLSVKTVEAHQTRLRKKLKLADTAALREYAVQWVRSENTSR